MNRYSVSRVKALQRAQIERDIRAFLAAGGIIQSVDHTHNASWRDKAKDKNNRYTRGDFTRL